MISTFSFQEKVCYNTNVLNTQKKNTYVIHLSHFSVQVVWDRTARWHGVGQWERGETCVDRQNNLRSFYTSFSVSCGQGVFLNLSDHSWLSDTQLRTVLVCSVRDSFFSAVTWQKWLWSGIKNQYIQDNLWSPIWRLRRFLVMKLILMLLVRCSTKIRQSFQQYLVKEGLCMQQIRRLTPV